MEDSVGTDGNLSKKEETSEAVRQLCTDYAAFLNVAAVFDEQKTSAAPAVEGLLGKLEEFHALVDVIRTEKQKNKETLLPRLMEEAQVLEAVFILLDVFKEVIIQTDTTMTRLEDQISALERAGTLKSIARFLPLKKQLGQRKSPSQTPSPVSESPRSGLGPRPLAVTEAIADASMRAVRSLPHSPEDYLKKMDTTTGTSAPAPIAAATRAPPVPAKTVQSPPTSAPAPALPPGRHGQ